MQRTEYSGPRRHRCHNLIAVGRGPHGATQEGVIFVYIHRCRYPGLKVLPATPDRVAQITGIVTQKLAAAAGDKARLPSGKVTQASLCGFELLLVAVAYPKLPINDVLPYLWRRILRLGHNLVEAALGRPDQKFLRHPYPPITAREG